MSSTKKAGKPRMDKCLFLLCFVIGCGSGLDEYDCITQSYKGCWLAAGEGADIRWFDSCNRPEEIIIDCPDLHSECVVDDNNQPECKCTNSWSGYNCDYCPDNWDESQDCAVCSNKWQGENCDLCPEHWDPQSNCSSCLGNRDVGQDCAVCKVNWIDDDNDCGACKNQFDPNTDCQTCLQNWLGEECDTPAPGAVLWTFDVGLGWEYHYSYSSPAIAIDGTIYVGGSKATLLALNPDGSLKWTSILVPLSGGSVPSSPSIGQDGTIYAGSYVYQCATNPDGSQKWSIEIFQDSFFTAIGLDGKVYFWVSNTNLWSVNPDGTLNWVFWEGEGSRNSPAIDSDGTIYGGSDKLYALRPDKTMKWIFEPVDKVNTSLAIGIDHTIYFGAVGGRFYAVNQDGTLKWSMQVEGGVGSAPSIDVDGTIYFGSLGNKVYAVNPDGTLKWTFEVGDRVYSCPAIGANGVIYFGSYDKKVYAVNADGTLKWSFEGDNWFSGLHPTLADNGNLYIVDRDGKLYCIYTESGGLADSPWPKFQHDLQNTGRASSE
jgi:outer membrane protein assembly factor BamB